MKMNNDLHLYCVYAGFFMNLFCPSFLSAQDISLNTARSGRIFQIFQFPHHQMPRIDGDTSDWSMVPSSYTYGTTEIKDTEDGRAMDRRDLDVRVTIGWVKGINRIYFLYQAYDDYWDFGRFNPQGYLNDIFELVVDGDLSGGPFIFNPIYAREKMSWDSKTSEYLDNHMHFSGVHAQNYHMFTPPVNNAWTLVWGSQPWISEFPYANVAYHYDFKPGESGFLTLEGWITPYDYAPSTGPQKAQESSLFENKIIGLSWSILDFDGGTREGHHNLSWNTQMVKDASYLCAFRLMPLEPTFLSLKADWTYTYLGGNQVAFEDRSTGEVEHYHWDFGDGSFSKEKNPVHFFRENGVHKVITLMVQGPLGESKRTRYWEVMIH